MRWFAVVVVGVLWLGKLLPKLPREALVAGLVAHLALLAGCLAVGLRASGPAGGFASEWRGRWLPIGIAGGIGLFLVAGLGYTLSARVLGLTPPAELDLVRGGGVRLALLGAGAVLAAILEEWVFRGVLLDALAGSAIVPALLTSAAAFAAYHLSVFQLAPTFLLGLGLAGLVLGLGSLWPAIVAHIVFNLIGLALTAGGMGAG